MFAGSLSRQANAPRDPAGQQASASDFVTLSPSADSQTSKADDSRRVHRREIPDIVPQIEDGQAAVLESQSRLVGP